MKTLRLLCLLVLLLGSCGYGLQADPGSRFADRSLRVDLRPFANASIVPEAGALLAGKLREEFRNAGFRGVYEHTNADFVIDGIVKEIREDVISHATDDFALEHRLSLVVNVRVTDPVRGRIYWKEDGLTESASYFSGADFQYTDSNRRAAIGEVCRRMARRICQTVKVVL